MHHVIADTNLFIQCRALHEVSWKKLFGDDEILILVVPKVAQEIDFLKADGKGRRAKRARQATEILRKLLESDEPLVIRERDPRVSIGFTPETGRPQDRHDLDPDYSDHRILLQALEYREKHQGIALSFLTHETHQQLTARRLKFPCKQIPDEWLLADEPDERERELRSLQSELDELRNAEPRISVSIANASTGSDHTFLNVVRYSPLSEHLAEKYAEMVASDFPMVTDFSEPNPHRPNASGFGLNAEVFRAIAAAQRTLLQKEWRGPSDASIVDYQRKKYPAWKAKLKEFFLSLHLNLEEPQRAVVLNFLLNNSGTRPAVNALVEVSAKGSALICAHGSKSDDVPSNIELPPPPVPPRGKYLSPLEIFERSGMFGILGGAVVGPNFDSMLGMSNHFSSRLRMDEFDWTTAREGMPQSMLTRSCGTWRHQVEPDCFSVDVILSRREQEPSSWSAVIVCKVSAENLSKPIEVLHKLSVSVTHGDIEVVAREIVENGYSAGVLFKFEADVG